MELEFNIDLTSIKELKPIPPAIVILQIDSVKAGQSKAGNTMLHYATTILAPDDICEKVDKFYFSLTLVDSALWLVKQLQQACGVEIVPGSFNAEAVVGCQVGAKVDLRISEEYGIRNQVSKFYRVEKTIPEVRGDWPPEDEEVGDEETV